MQVIILGCKDFYGKKKRYRIAETGKPYEIVDSANHLTSGGIIVSDPDSGAYIDSFRFSYNDEINSELLQNKGIVGLRP